MFKKVNFISLVFIIKYVEVKNETKQIVRIAILGFSIFLFQELVLLNK